MSFAAKILVELVSGVLLGLFSTSMRPCSRWRRMGSSSTAPTGGGRGGGADWYPFLELGQAPTSDHTTLVHWQLAKNVQYRRLLVAPKYTNIIWTKLER